MSATSFSVETFGVPDFKWYLFRNGWIVFRNRSEPLLTAPNDMEKLYHATTLSQSRDILQDGFRVGLYHAGSASSPAGIWGSSHPGHSIDRAPVARGYSCHTDNDDKNILCGWDCPVVFAWDIEEWRLQTHEMLYDGTRILVHKQPCGTTWNTRDRPTSIWFHIALYERFKILPTLWHTLQEGTAVVCRSESKKPSDLYKAGHAAPMTCGRVCPIDQLETEK